MHCDIKKTGCWIVVVALVMAGFFLMRDAFAATPSGPAIQYVGNETSVTHGVPTRDTYGDSQGGYIVTMLLTARQQNEHYKAYVGNITGNYVLEDANNFSIYEWSISTIAGEVFATRTSGTVTWSNVKCANVSNVEQEMLEMHNNSTNTPDDDINKTFDDDANDHWGFWAGSSVINANSCNYSINPYVNDTAQTSSDLFEEVLLYDGSSNLIYVTRIENDQRGYRNDSVTTYDFQLIVAENGSHSASQTDYYFYVQLS
jgi:hypothetical protein